MIHSLKKIEIIFNRIVLIYLSIAYVVLKNIFTVNTTFLTYVYMLYCILYFIIYVLIYKEKIIISKYLFGILFIFTFILSTVVNNRINRENIAIIIDVFINLFILLHIFDNSTNEEIDNLITKIFKFFVIFSCVWASIGIVFVCTNSSIAIFGNVFGLINQFRLQLVRPSINPTGFAALTFVACNVFFLFKKKIFNKVFIIANIIMQLLVIYFTQSFGTFLAAFIGVFIFAIYYGINNKKIVKSVIYTLFGIIIFLIVSTLIIKFFGAKSRIITDIKNLLENKDAFVSFRVRYEILVYGIIILLNNSIIFGSSYGGLKVDWTNGFNLATSKYNFSKFFISESPIVCSAATHNVYLTILFANGIVGAIIFSAFIIFILYNIIRFYKNLNNIDISAHKIYLICIFLIVSGLVVALTAECIIVSIVDYTNFFFFISLSALINMNINNKIV